MTSKKLFLYLYLSIYVPVIPIIITYYIKFCFSFLSTTTSVRLDKRKERKIRKRVGQFLERVEYKTFSLIARLASKPNMLNPNEVRKTPVNASM